MQVRDAQKSKLYAAEREVRHAIGDVAIKDRIAAWAFIEKVERDRWFIRHYGRRKFTISDGRGTRIARGGGDWLNLPRWARTPMVMLHEIAHCVAPSGARHNWQYAAVYLKLVRHFMSVEIAEKLRRSFKRHGVRYLRPRQYTNTAARRASFERMIAGRKRWLEAANTPE